MQDKNANERSGKPNTTKQHEMSIQKKNESTNKSRNTEAKVKIMKSATVEQEENKSAEKFQGQWKMLVRRQKADKD